MKEHKLPSGATLAMGVTPFAISKSLFQAVLEEAKEVKLSNSSDVAALIKDLFCMGLSSKKVESALTKCLEKCTYNNLKIDFATFESDQAREDYLPVCLRVFEENILPFTKGLSVELPRFLAAFKSVQT